MSTLGIYFLFKKYHAKPFPLSFLAIFRLFDQIKAPLSILNKFLAEYNRWRSLSYSFFNQ